MELNLTTQPAPDGVTKVLTLEARDVIQPKRSRRLEDLASLVAYIKKWGDPAKGTIYWTDESVVALLDENDLVSGRGRQDAIVLQFARPIVAERWLAAIGNTFSHKKFKDFLELRWNEIANGADLFARISTLSLAQTFTYDANLQDDQSYSVAFKTEGGGDVAKLPKAIEVEIPLLKGLEKTYRLQLKLKFDVPKTEGATPTFTLVWEDKADVLEQAARDAVTTLAERLPEWLIVNGETGSGVVGS